MSFDRDPTKLMGNHLDEGGDYCIICQILAMIALTVLFLIVVGGFIFYELLTIDIVMSLL